MFLQSPLRPQSSIPKVHSFTSVEERHLQKLVSQKINYYVILYKADYMPYIRFNVILRQFANDQHHNMLYKPRTFTFFQI